MDKLTLHESLRIYIPGLLLSILLYCLFQSNTTGISNVAIPAIFVGFAINNPLHRIGKIYFGKLAINHKIKLNSLNENFFEHQKKILSEKYKYLSLNRVNNFDLIETNNFKAWDFIGYSHFAKIYDSPETSSFRLPKSFGIMCFNLFAVSILGPIIFLLVFPFINLELSTWHIVIIMISTLFGILFFTSSTAFLRSSLEKQLYYWNSLSKSEVESLVDYINIFNSIK